MWTINYKGYYIHGYFAKDECQVNGITYKSLHAAKCKITRRLIKQHDEYMEIIVKKMSDNENTSCVLS